jgi:UDP-GlcNAc:undecaprenyl-phosphate GlcNAc-1-phosphate transferase
MGDAGSTFLGFTLGVESARAGLPPNGPPWAWAVPLAILAVPCYDMTSVVFLRVRQGRSPFHADKQHLSHRLVERGLSKKAAVGVIYLLALASGATGLALLLVTTPPAAALVGGQLVTWWVAFAVVEWRSVRRTSSTEITPPCAESGPAGLGKSG